MANNLPMEKKIAVIGSLVEGGSIRGTERMLGIYRNTIMNLGLRVGQACEMIADREMVDLTCDTIQMDEIYAFIKNKPFQSGKKKPQAAECGIGEIYTFVSMDRDTRLVPNYKVGTRNTSTAIELTTDLAKRLKNKPKIHTDAFRSFTMAVDLAFGPRADYGQVVKTFASSMDAKGKYIPPQLVDLKPKVISGNPGHISTSYIERQNLTIRTHCKRLARLTSCFSKKLDNFKAAVSLHFLWYNMVRIHTSLKTSPAVAAGVIKTPWTLAELVERAEGEWNI